jgi:hypothetical protein
MTTAAFWLECPLIEFSESDAWDGEAAGDGLDAASP